MSKAKQVYVKEQVTELKRLLVNRSITVSNRIRMLILHKFHYYNTQKSVSLHFGLKIMYHYGT